MRFPRASAASAAAAPPTQRVAKPARGKCMLARPVAARSALEKSLTCVPGKRERHPGKSPAWGVRLVRDTMCQQPAAMEK